MAICQMSITEHCWALGAIAFSGSSGLVHQHWDSDVIKLVKYIFQPGIQLEKWWKNVRNWNSQNY